MSAWIIPLCIGLVTTPSPPAALSRTNCLLSGQQRSECAARFADTLRAWETVVASQDGVDLAAPILIVRKGLTAPDARIDLYALLRAVQLRIGAKVRFIRRDDKDPAFLPFSDRFDYETRLRVATARERSDHPLRLVLEVYEPAGESPVFSLEYTFSPRRQAALDRRADPPVTTASETSRRTDATQGPEKQTVAGEPSEAARPDLDPEDTFGRGAARSIMLDVGQVYFMDKKTASRVVITSAQGKPLDDGRLEVLVTFVSRKDDQDVKVRASFYDQAGRRVEEGRRKKYEFEQGRPRTIQIRSTRPAVRYRLTVQDD